MRQNRELYQVLYTMFSRFDTIDPVTVVDRMKQAGVYDEFIQFLAGHKPHPLQ